MNIYIYIYVYIYMYINCFYKFGHFIVLYFHCFTRKLTPINLIPARKDQ